MIIPVYKPIGWTSFEVVKKIRSITGEKRVGHGGTLDPFADGLLIIGIGKSTKLLSKYSNLKKEYRAKLKLGQETDTLDLDGTVIKSIPVPQISVEKIKKVFKLFVGELLQVPPMYSAKKINGVRLYKLARRNEVVHREPVSINIYSLEFLSIKKDVIEFQVTCSKGTYVRQLGIDIAKALGTTGHLVSLTRLRIGEHHISDSIYLEKIEEWLSIAA